MNPLKEKGTPLEKQIMNWAQMNPPPYDKKNVHPYTRVRIILMNGAEFDGNWFKHHFARHCDDIDIKRRIALTRRLEQQQQKMINGLIPGNESTIETTLGYEQVAVDLTACLAKNEPDENVKAALDFALLEDFDHLYRYSNLYELLEGKDATDIVGEYTEIFPGRPTKEEHRHPFDSVFNHYDKKTADIVTKLNVLTITAGEQQTMNYYMNVANRFEDEIARGLYSEIAMIEEEHVSQYESLEDPTMSWFECNLLHEYGECYLYYSCMETETDKRIRKIWEHNLDYELAHLREAAEMLEKYEDKEAESVVPDSFPEPLKIESSKDYVREILESQIDLTADGTDFVNVNELPENHRYNKYQKIVNRGTVPSNQVIKDHVEKFGGEYRLSTEGEHPVKRLREKQKVGK